MSLAVTIINPQFQPSDAQHRLLEFVHAHPGYHTVLELAAGADIDRATYFRWCQDANFRAWFTREWSSLLLFEGWHTLNLVRAHVVSSPTALRILTNLLFDPRGQAALDGWCQRSAAGPTAVASPNEQNQQLASQDATFSGPNPASNPTPNPTKVIRLLASTMDQANAKGKTL